MSGEQPPRRRWLPVSLSLPVLSLTIAGLSMVSSITQSYNYRRNIETVQQNVVRAENLKTCRDIIEIFFAFRLKAEEAQALGQSDANMLREMRAAVYRFGALGTYLANFAPELTRERYARLSWLMNDMAMRAASLNANDFDAKFTEIDRVFGSLNEDCVKSAQFIRI